VVPSKLGLLANHSHPSTRDFNHVAKVIQAAVRRRSLPLPALSFAANICAPASSSWF
jgi:hypothetical protein